MSILDGGDSINRRLAGRWLLDEAGGGIAKNLVPGGATGTFVSTPTHVVSLRGRAVKFNGTSSYINVPNFRWPATSPVTVAFWSTLNAAAPARASAFSVGASSSPNMFQAHAPWNDSFLYWEYGASSITTSLSSFLGKTVLITLTHNGSNSQSVYVNGVLKTTIAVGAAPGAVTGLQIGAWSTIGAYENAALRDFRIWARALRPQEIQRLYQEPSAGLLLPSTRMRFTRYVESAAGSSSPQVVWIS